MQPGDIIRFRYTGDKGKIIIDYLDGSFKILLLSDNEDIIAFRDDIVLEQNFKGVEKSSAILEKGQQKIKGLSTEEMFYTKEELDQKKRKTISKGFIDSKKEEIKLKTDQKEENEVSEFFIPVFKETMPRNTGLWLAFAPQSNHSYIIYLVNDSLYSFKFEFKLILNGNQVQSLNQTIGPHIYFPVGEFNHDMLNDSPVFDFKCPGYGLHEQLKIKYKKWIGMKKEVPIIGIICHSYNLIESKQLAKTDLSLKGDIKTYTHEQLKDKVKDKLVKRYYNKNDLRRLAHFKNEIDLHAEALFPELSGLTPREIFEMQKLALENYMQQAIELGVSEVFIIHGLGEGILRKAVDDYLKNLKNDNLIQEYKNEFLQKYGFGATWVRI